MIQDMILKMTEITPEAEDYMSEDGLLYCGKCRTPREAYFEDGKTLFGLDRHPADCACRKAERIKREEAEKHRNHLQIVEDLKRNGFINDEMRNWTFEKLWKQRTQSEIARVFVEDFVDMQKENMGLLFWGKVGTGKSYLAGCIANALMEKEIPVCMTNFTAILHTLENSFVGRNEYIDRLCHYPLLIIDDLGKERGTEYSLEQVYDIIDSRYRSRKPLIVTTNYTYDMIKNPQDTAHARIYDRLREMCVAVMFDGENFRDKIAQDKYNSLSNRMKNRKDTCL